MSYEIGIGPSQLTINVGDCVLITDPDGSVRQPGERGLFFRDTRVLSEWSVSVNGRFWRLRSGAATRHFAAQAVLDNPALPIDGGEIPAGTIALTLSRLLGHGGLRETLVLRNHNRVSVRLVLAVRTASDFADIFDVKSHRIVARGETGSAWRPADGCLETVHRNGAFGRGLRIAPAPGAPVPALRCGALCWTVELAPQAAWDAELRYEVGDHGGWRDAPAETFAARHESGPARDEAAWRAEALQLRTPYAPLQALFDQSVGDLSALRLPIAGTDHCSFVPAAGIPWFAALFGRDSLLAAIQTVPVFPDFARGALEVLARYQADGFDDERDMQPGKIPHELRHGELAELGLVPYRPYYGTADATPLYLILLHHAWRFTGDHALIEQHRATAERCLDWIDAHGDLDGDGFQEYRRRSAGGAENQAWKDSGNAILDEEGEDVSAPKALCELQGYVFDAWRRMAEVFDALGRADRADALRNKAAALYRRFNAAFWNEDLGFYALCLDGGKRPVLSVASNPGHLLWSGIVPPDRAARVRDRLLAPDMWSGWGVRTLSTAHPAYNPLDYQLGAIWPHDNGLIALGLKRYGFHHDVARIARGLLDAGSRFQLNQLPEVFAGLGRDECPFPVQYPGANVPQAWAAGTVFLLLRAMLGIHVDASAGIVYADPALPDWLPGLTLDNLRLGGRTVTLRADRAPDGITSLHLDGTNGLRLEHRSLYGGFTLPG